MANRQTLRLSEISFGAATIPKSTLYYVKIQKEVQFKENFLCTYKFITEPDKKDVLHCLETFNYRDREIAYEKVFLTTSNFFFDDTNYRIRIKHILIHKKIKVDGNIYF